MRKSVVPKVNKNVISYTTTHNEERFYIQAGSFISQPKKDFLLSIERLGLPYKVKYSQKYKVLIGPYSKESDARKALQKVRSTINKGAFLSKL